MEQSINEGGVQHIATSVHSSSTLSSINAYIHHELTPERRAELEAAVESMIMRFIAGWVKL